MNKGYVFIFIAVLLWAVSSGVLVKLTTIPSIPFFCLGAFWGTLFILSTLIIKKELLSLQHYSKRQHILMTLIGATLGIGNLLFFIALKNGLIANAVLSHSLYPILIVLFLAPFFLNEKLSFSLITLALLSFLGLIILMIPTFHKSFDVALFYGFLSAIFVGISSTIEKKLAQEIKNPLIPVLYKNAVPFCLLLPLSLQTLHKGISLSNWAITALWGILILGVSFVFYFKSLQKIPVSHASIIGYLEPVGAILLAFLFFKQVLDIYVILGGLLIVLSGIILVKVK